MEQDYIHMPLPANYSATAGPSRRRSQFRPCIDLHQGVVKQIVGGTLDLGDAGVGLQGKARARSSGEAEKAAEGEQEGLKTNFVAAHPSSFYAELYRQHDLRGGHVIKLGPGNDDAAREALKAWPGGLQVGGGIAVGNAKEWLDAGADKVIVTSFLFPDAKFSEERLAAMSQLVGKDRLVVDISCRKRENGWVVAMNGWKTLTDMVVNQDSIALVEKYCSELLIHAADVEGLCQGIDEELVERLGEWASVPCTYAGGAKDISDLALVDWLSGGKVDLTFGSSLDIFGGSGVKFDELVAVDKAAKQASAA